MDLNSPQPFWSQLVHRPWRQCLRLLAMLLACMALVEGTRAQSEPVSRDLYQERLRNEGNTIAFCLRPIGPLAAFETELAHTLGQVLLTQVRTYVIGPQNFPVSPTEFEYIFGLTDDQIFIMMAEHCDVLMGMHLSTAAPEWLRLSRPYIVARILAVTHDPAVKTLADLAPGARVGVQALAAGDAGLTSYLRTLPEDQAPQRVIFRDNRALYAALADRQVDATLMWEGALLAGTQGDVAGYYTMESLPFPVDTVQISAAVRAPDSFLGALIDDALGVLEADGTLAEMAVRHHILWPEQP